MKVNNAEKKLANLAVCEADMYNLTSEINSE